MFKKYIKNYFINKGIHIGKLTSYSELNSFINELFPFPVLPNIIKRLWLEKLIFFLDNKFIFHYFLN